MKSKTTGVAAKTMPHSEGLNGRQTVALVGRVFLLLGPALLLGLWLAEALEDTPAQNAMVQLESWLVQHVAGGWLDSWKVVFWLCGFALVVGMILRSTYVERRRAKLHAQLEASLTKLVSEFLPICMHCKAIRGADDHWETIENYLSSTRKLKVSHGMCPNCFAKLFPDNPVIEGKEASL